jgi:Skp family chaperone for outer membrane proteins
MFQLRQLLVVLTLVFAWAVASPVAHAAGEIAVVDFQKALDEVKEGEAARKKLESLYEAKKVEIGRMETDLQAKMAELEKQAVILSPDALQDKQRALYEEQMRYQQVAMQAEQEMQMSYAQVMEDLIAKMKKICTKIGQERGYALILETGDQGLLMGAGGVVYSGGAADLTGELITRYNQQNPG